jgi:energy-coupling factor transporter ATP-binding protein EcfA2
MLNEVTERYTIRRIRLINFHNFVDETIEIRHGGHLFLLGDNASGKTTVLDAVHYVLTAGESMEFNSAARIAGSREEGRRIQGVILRYNVDTGPLNPSGGTTYAALEIAGRHGTLTTVAVGMTATGMDEKVQRWGIIRECPLEKIPLPGPGAARPPPGEPAGDAGLLRSDQRLLLESHRLSARGGQPFLWRRRGLPGCVSAVVHRQGVPRDCLAHGRLP